MAKILVYDIETAPAIGLFFGKTWDTSIAKVIQHEYVFGFAYKWVGERSVKSCYIWDFDDYHKDRKDPTNVLKRWSQLVSAADVIVGHNSDSFDYKQMFGRLVQYNLPPVAKPQTADTKKMAKQIGYYPSNKLDDLSERFGYGNKMHHQGIDLWWDCMQDEMKAKRKMVAYNKRDVELTEKLYLKFRPYSQTHPNMAVIDDRPGACPKCGKEGQMIGAGIIYSSVPKQRWQCKSCGAYSRSRRTSPGIRSDYV